MAAPEKAATVAWIGKVWAKVRTQTMKDRISSNIALVLLTLSILAGIGVRGWAASQWQANFDSDEAIFGLMALHISEGEFVPTVYGTQHLGSIESVVAAGLFRLLGVHVITFRLSTILMMSIFFVVHAWYARRVWGTTAAILSTAFLAFPGFHVLVWSHQPVGAYAALLTLGTAVLALSESNWPNSVRTKLFVAGVLAGLGLWSNQMLVVYLAAVLIPAVLMMEEWARLYSRVTQFVDDRIGIPAREFIPSLVLVFGVLAVIAFFSRGCPPTWQYERAEALARAGLLIVAMAGGLGVVAVSARRKELFVRYVCGAIGFLVGFSPLWLSWVARIQQPVSVIRPSCPTGVINRSQLLVQEILPELIGIRALPRAVHLSLMAQVFWLFVLGASLLAAVWFLWQYRKSLWALVPLRPIQSQESARSISLGVIFLGPLALSALGNNTADIHSIRHLLVTWHGMMLIFGLFVSWIIARRRRLGLLLAGIWLASVGVSNLAYASQNWLIKFTRFDQQPVSQLEVYLEGKGVSTGFADYWGAYALDFLTEERVLVAPYNGLDRIPAYTSAVKAANRQFILFPRTRAPEASSKDALTDFMMQENLVSGEGPARGWILEAIGDSRILSREYVAYWDVWILGK